MSRLTTPFIGVALVAGAVWVAMQSYQKNFAGPALSEAEQQTLGIQLLEFPRQLPPIEQIPSTQWHAIRLQPPLCDAMCQGNITQQSALGILIIPPSQAVYQDLQQVTSGENYANHKNKVLLINAEGKFAGSLLPPYNQSRIDNALSALNH